MKHLAITYFFLVLVTGLNAQLNVLNLKELPKIKAGPTYVIVNNDMSSNAAKDYMALWDKYWPYAKLTFISPGEIPKYLNENSSFITIATYKTDVAAQYGSTPAAWGNIDTELKVWTCIEPRASGPTARDRYTNPATEYSMSNFVASYSFHAYPYDKNAPKLAFPEIFFDPKEDDTTGRKPDTTFAAGFMRNYIQQIVLAFNNNKEEWSQNRANDALVAKLKSDTLYVPNWLVNSHDEPKEFFSNYPYPYKIVSLFELNKKLVEYSDAFYYLDGHKFPAFIFLKIIDSKTGEVIYLDRSTVTRSYKVVMDKLGKKIGKLK